MKIVMWQPNAQRRTFEKVRKVIVGNKGGCFYMRDKDAKPTDNFQMVLFSHEMDAPEGLEIFED